VWVQNLGKLDFMSHHNPDVDSGVSLWNTGLVEPTEAALRPRWLLNSVIINTSRHASLCGLTKKLDSWNSIHTILILFHSIHTQLWRRGQICLLTHTKDWYSILLNWSQWFQCHITQV
jgi:hypothetical protein